MDFETPRGGVRYLIWFVNGVYCFPISTSLYREIVMYDTCFEFYATSMPPAAYVSPWFAAACVSDQDQPQTMPEFVYIKVTFFFSCTDCFVGC